MKRLAPILIVLAAACGDAPPGGVAPFAPAPLPPPSPERDAAIERMIEAQIRPMGVKSERVIAAFRRVTRDAFLPPGLRPLAFEDRAVRRPDGEAVTAPDLAGAMLETLALGPDSRILECGTRSGWLTALLAVAGGEVFTIDARPEATAGAQAALGLLGIGNVRFRVGDPAAGWPEESPFDAVVVNGAVPHIPRALYEMLVTGGRILAPVGAPGEEQTLVLSVKGGPEPLETRAILTVRFGALPR